MNRTKTSLGCSLKEFFAFSKTNRGGSTPLLNTTHRRSFHNERFRGRCSSFSNKSTKGSFPHLVAFPLPSVGKAIGAILPLHRSIAIARTRVSRICSAWTIALALVARPTCVDFQCSRQSLGHALCAHKADGNRTLGIPTDAVHNK